jgi:hypothetical protein
MVEKSWLFELLYCPQDDTLSKTKKNYFKPKFSMTIFKSELKIKSKSQKCELNLIFLNQCFKMQIWDMLFYFSQKNNLCFVDKNVKN